MRSHFRAVTLGNCKRFQTEKLSQIITKLKKAAELKIRDKRDYCLETRDKLIKIDYANRKCGVYFSSGKIIVDTRFSID